MRVIGVVIVLNTDDRDSYFLVLNASNWAHVMTLNGEVVDSIGELSNEEPIKRKLYYVSSFNRYS